MIPILYKANETEFKTYGIGALSDIITCSVTEERNSTYECVFTYPITGAFYSEIQNERIIKAKPNDTSENQAFRIYRITKPLKGIVKVYAQHISYDLNGIAAALWEGGTYTPQLAIEHVFNNALMEHNFTFTTDYTEAKEFSVSKPKSVRAVLGGEEGSLISLWGGEFEWDNYKVIHHQGRGNNNGVVIEYGKNLTKLEHDLDISEVYTHLLPYATYTDEDGNETLVTLTEQLLTISDAALVQPKTLIKDFSDSFEYGEEITEDMLREKAENYLENNPLGAESPSVTISFESLWKQPEYAAVLERVSLCDTVTVKHTDLGVSVKSKVIKTVYDTLAEKYTSITLGSAKSSLLTTLSETQSEVESVSNKTDRFSTLMTTAISNATSLITGQTGGYVVLHGDDTGQPYELLILDTPNIEDAVNVWRWNSGGLGFSSNGYNGPYKTAITADGQIVADFIATGTLAANLIKAGIISSADGSSYWNIETGEIVINNYATQTGGTASSFGYSLTANDFTLTANNTPILQATSSGLSVQGAITATSLTLTGSVSGLSASNVSGLANVAKTGAASDLSGLATVATTGSYSSLSNTPDLTVYISKDGTVGSTPSSGATGFKVTSAGLLTASNAVIYGTIYATAGTIGGLMLSDSSITSDNFTVTSTGAVTAKDIAITGGSLSISGTEDGESRSVSISSNGYLKAAGATLSSFYSTTGTISSIDNSGTGSYLKFRNGDINYTNSNGITIRDSSNLNTYSEVTGQSITLNYNGSQNYRYRVYYTDHWLVTTSLCDIEFGYAMGSSSHVGILCQTSGNATMYGTWYTESAITVTSDANLKNSIEDLSDEYSTLFDNLRPVRFKYNNGHSDRYHTGFIAQELESAIEMAGLTTQDVAAYVEMTKDGEVTRGIRYEEIIAMCVKEIQKLKKRVKALEEEKK